MPVEYDDQLQREQEENLALNAFRRKLLPLFKTKQFRRAKIKVKQHGEAVEYKILTKPNTVGWRTIRLGRFHKFMQVIDYSKKDSEKHDYVVVVFQLTHKKAAEKVAKFLIDNYNAKKVLIVTSHDEVYV